MRKAVFLVLAAMCSAALNAKTIYLNTGGSGLWNQAGAVFFVHSWDASTNTDIKMTEASMNVFKADIKDSHTSVIFLRMPSGSTGVIWDGDGKFWNKTADLNIPSGMDLYTISGWGANNSPVCPGNWSKTDTGGSGGGGGESGGGESGGGGGEPTQDPTKWFLKGTFNGWKAETELVGTTEVLTATLNLEAGKEYEFKINKGDDWYGNDGTMTQAHHTDWGFAIKDGGNNDMPNCKLATNIAGEYVFAFNSTTKVVSVTYPNNPKQAELYASAIRDENSDVLLQSFYWAHEGSSATPFTTFGDVTWSKLAAEAEDLAQFFDIVWLAPSQETADYTGYLPMNYSNQGTYVEAEGHHGHSPWGTAQDLRTLIDKLHQGGAKVVADIVLNHTSAGHVDEYSGGDKNWCTWTENDFGQYGKFTPDWSWITADDEMYATDKVSGRIDKSVTGDCGAHGGDASLVGDESGYTIYEDGNKKTAYWSYSEYNSTYSRDLAHGKKEVREMSRAYLTWMRDSIGYDGWRWDFMKGFEGKHLFDYNRTTAPYFSVAEVFDGDINKQLGVLEDFNYSTYVFDFPGKFTIYNEAIGAYALNLLQSKKYSLLFTDKKKYAVSFIDNHDSFREESNMLGKEHPNELDDMKSPMALAYLLSMPGVPCVFYPYWNNYKDACVKLIKARKSAGVHSESSVKKEWAGSGSMGQNYYTALIEGKKGYLFLKLGYDCYPKNTPSEASPDGKAWKLAWAQDYKGECHAAVWYTGDDWEPEVPSAVEMVEPTVKATKFLENGMLYIQRGNEVYTMQGLRVR